jgi:hypothetical protein
MLFLKGVRLMKASNIYIILVVFSASFTLIHCGRKAPNAPKMAGLAIEKEDAKSKKKPTDEGSDAKKDGEGDGNEVAENSGIIESPTITPTPTASPTATPCPAEYIFTGDPERLCRGVDPEA